MGLLAWHTHEDIAGLVFRCVFEFGMSHRVLHSVFCLAFVWLCGTRMTGIWGGILGTFLAQQLGWRAGTWLPCHTQLSLALYPALLGLSKYTTCCNYVLLSNSVPYYQANITCPPAMQETQTQTSPPKESSLPKTNARTSILSLPGAPSPSTADPQTQYAAPCRP